MTTATQPTPVEASFLELERKGFPMHVAALMVLDGDGHVELSELKHLVASRLRRLPRFRDRAVTLFGGLGAAWSPVDRVDYDAHIFHHVLPSPGDSPQLNSLCAAIHEEPLDRHRPLWEMHLISGLTGGRQALLLKSHHAITDGLAGVEISEVLFDSAAGATRPTVPATHFLEDHRPTAFTAAQGLVGLAFAAASGPIALGGPFNGPVGNSRSFGTATLSLESVRRIKRRLGGSVDDVLLATIAAGLNAYLHDIKYPGIPPALKAMVPVSTRPLAPGSHFGNHVSAVFVDLPMHVSDLGELVHRVAASKATLRTAHAALGGAMLVAAAGRLPRPVHSGLMRLVSEVPFANLVVSDVPGPDEPLYLLGRRIEACYPMMPLSPRVGLSIAAVSMGGRVGLGVTAAPGLVPDPQRLAAAIGRVLPRWSAAIGARTPRGAGFRPNARRAAVHRLTHSS